MAKREVGKCVVTPGAIQALEKTGESPTTFLGRHASGDWGELPDEDHQPNESARIDGERVFSAHTLLDGTKIWVITVSDRSLTTILLPDEY
jgi:hypothetical protein